MTDSQFKWENYISKDSFRSQPLVPSTQYPVPSKERRITISSTQGPAKGNSFQMSFDPINADDCPDESASLHSWQSYRCLVRDYTYFSLSTSQTGRAPIHKDMNDPVKYAERDKDHHHS